MDQIYKPKPGLIVDAATKYKIDLAQSFMIGDRWRDIEAGQNAGCKTVWIDRGYDEKKPDPPADFTAHSLAEATQWILGDRLYNRLKKLHDAGIGATDK